MDTVDKMTEMHTGLAQPSAVLRANLVPWIGAILLVLAMVLYGLTLDNGLQPGELEGGDLITHHYAQVQARPSNAPGYPLYTMGGWLWFHTIRATLHLGGVAMPNPIPILSSYSTLWALMALGLLYAMLCHLTRSPGQPRGDGWLAALLCAFYAVTYFFWYYATTTEQYSSAIAQTLAIVYLYLRWQDRWQSRDITALTTGKARPWLADPAIAIIVLAFLCGLALAHMLTVAFLVPPLVLVILWQAPQLLRTLWVVFGAVLAAVLPLVSYLYVYWRGTTHPEWWGSGHWDSPQAWFWAFVSTAQGREELGWGLGAACTFFANGFPELIWQELSWPIVILGLVGIARLEKRLATLLYGTLAIYLAFCWAYRCGNWFQVILPVYPLLLLGIAAWVQEWREHKQWGRVAYSVAMLLLLLAVGWRFNLSLSAADSRNRPNDSAFDRAALLLAQPLPANAHLFAAVQDALALQYLSAIWQIQPDTQVINSAVAAQVLAAGQPVYSTWEAAATLRAELPAELQATQQAVDPDWVAFVPSTLSLPFAPAITLDQSATIDVVLHGYTVDQAPRSPLAAYRQAIDSATDGVILTLFWQPLHATWPAGVSISVRALQGNQPLLDAQGSPLQIDRQQPATALYQLAPGQLIVDPYRLAIPAGAVTQLDTIQILLYRAIDGGFENLAELRLPVTLNRP